MTASDIEAIVKGCHVEPFRVLGPHECKPKRGMPQWEVCAFLPQAASASVVANGTAVPMTRRHPAGLFASTLTSEPGHYRLRVKDTEGHETEIEDPYRFPLVLTEFDLHLHGEGTNYESYRSMGAHVVTV